MALGETLTDLRKAKGLSQEQLAEELDITRQTISKWELNQSTPDINYLVQLSDFFCVSTDYLIKGEQSNNAPDCDNTDFESSNTEHIETRSSSCKIYTWCFYLGAISTGVSLIGIIAFVICSALHPWGALVGNMYFEGLMGFLIGTKTLWFFIILSALFIAGCSISVFGIVKYIRAKH